MHQEPVCKLQGTSRAEPQVSESGFLQLLFGSAGLDLKGQVHRCQEKEAIYEDHSHRNRFSSAPFKIHFFKEVSLQEQEKDGELLRTEEQDIKA